METLDYKKDVRYGDIEIGRAYNQMAFILEHYVMNVKAGRAARVISLLWLIGFKGLAKTVARFTIYRWVSYNEWLLVKHYGKKHKII